MSYPFQICCRERLTNIVTYHPFLQIYVNLEKSPPAQGAREYLLH